MDFFVEDPSIYEQGLYFVEYTKWRSPTHCWKENLVTTIQFYGDTMSGIAQ